MKIKTKIVGLSLAVVTLTSCLSSVTISAADNNIVKDGISNLESQMMTIEEVEFFRRIKNEYESKKDQLRSYSFAQYNTYVTNQQSSTTHYLAVVGDQYDWFGDCNIHYYLNTNLFGAAYSNINNYLVGSSYSSTSSIGSSISCTTVSLNACMISVPFTTSLYLMPDYSEVFRFKLGKVELANFTEELWNRCTSQQYSNPSDYLFASDPNGSPDPTQPLYTFKKCVYSLGDLDRDGDVDSTDSLLLTAYLDGIYFSGSHLNETAFRLAADTNADGVVDSSDLIKLNQFLLGMTTL